MRYTTHSIIAFAHNIPVHIALFSHQFPMQKLLQQHPRERAGLRVCAYVHTLARIRALRAIRHIVTHTRDTHRA
jgi:hypothetical protein